MTLGRRIYLIIICIVLLLSAAAISCSSSCSRSEEFESVSSSSEYQETLTQISTIGALLNGVYDGVIPYSDLKEYGDFGIGTFEALDGEMIALNGDFYQVKADGVAYEVEGSMKTPFACVTFFDTDMEAKLAEGMDYADIREFIDSLIPTENIFYAIKVSGTFSYVKTRSVPRQTKPYAPLVEVTKNQPIFEFHHVKGTIVGFRSPPYVAGGLNVPGYHLHFITEDRNAGGHLLELEVKDANVSLDYTSKLFMILPSESSDFYQLDLTKVKQEELEKAEK
jgi:acetolactate decarboxylase